MVIDKTDDNLIAIGYNLHYFTEDRINPTNYVFKLNKHDVGKFYYPVDNSWQKSLTNDNEYPCLAGMNDGSRVLVLIVSAPYNELIEFIGKTYLNTFVNVLYNGNIYRVLNYFSNFKNSPC